MKILAVNTGSSSLKFTAYEMPEEKVLMTGTFEKIGLEDSFYTIKYNGEKVKKEVFMPTHEKAANLVIEELLNNKIVDSLEEIKGVGHRVVHGGDRYNGPAIIDNKVIKDIEELAPLAPLHNPAHLKRCKKRYQRQHMQSFLIPLFIKQCQKKITFIQYHILGIVTI